MGRRGTRISYWRERQRERDPLEIERCRWVDNIKVDPGKIEWADIDWIGLAHDMDKWKVLVNAIMNLQDP
jgi:hypothetical protein